MAGNLNDCIVKGAYDRRALKRLLPSALELKNRVNKGPIGIGIWEGCVTSRTQGLLDEGEQIALFSDDEIICICGPKGDARSEAFAAWVMFMWNSTPTLAAELMRF